MLVFKFLHSRSLAVSVACASAVLLSSCQDSSLPQAISPFEVEPSSSILNSSDRVSSIFQGAPNNVKVADAAIAGAIANLPANTLNSEVVATASNALLRVPNNSRVEVEKLNADQLQPDCFNYSKFGETVDLRDVAFLLSGTSEVEITPEELLAGASKLLPPAQFPIFARDLAFIPGQTNPCQFNIQLRFMDDSLTPSQQTIVRQAADRWMSAIVSDQTDEPLRLSDFNLSLCAPDVPDIELIVDDLFIDVVVKDIDGEGNIKAAAGPCLFRPETSLPVYGVIQFDSADLTQITQNGRLAQIAVHEMAHVLGFGTIWEDLELLDKRLVNNPGFRGRQAVRAYAELGGSGNVPVESNAPDDANFVHWRQSVFGNELMTFEGQVGFVPLSRVTIAQFADLGYEVNLDAADPYELPNSSR